MFRFRRSLAMPLHYILWAMASVCSVLVLYRALEAQRPEQLALVAAPVLALQMAFAALLYNRARAVPSGPMQRRSLFAAEQAMTSAILFLFGVLLSLLTVSGYVLLVPHPFARPTAVEILTVLAIPFLLVLVSYGKFLTAIGAINPKKLTLGSPPIGSFLRAIK